MESELSMENLKYTGPFEAGESYIISCEDLFYEFGVYAVWPKDVKLFTLMEAKQLLKTVCIAIRMYSIQKD
jgi:hypothetical protein